MKNRLEVYIDEDEKNHIAVIINFNGPGGLIIADDEILATGRHRSESGKRLCITTRALIIADIGDGKPDISFVHER